MDAKDLAYAAARGGTPPTGVSDSVRALWLARAGRWAEAHQLCEKLDDRQGAWVHAHLHRVKGDVDKSVQWYQKAGMPVRQGQGGLGEEWLEMAEEFMAVPS